MRLQNRHHCPRKSGFTLVELLVVITIVGLLATISIPIVSRAKMSASSAHSVSNLRQIAVSIHLYSLDHGGHLPGPVWAGQGPTFVVSTSATAVNGNLGHHLRDYLPAQYSSAALGYNPIFEYSGWRANARDTNGPSYFINRFFRSQGVLYYPMGASRSGGVGQIEETMTMLQLSAHDLSGKILMHELDAAIVADSAGWKSMLPEKPVHGNHRNALYYDWSVRAVPLDAPLNP